MLGSRAYRYSQKNCQFHPVSLQQRIIEIWGRIQFLSAGSIDIHKNLVDSTPFLNDNKIYENQGQDPICSLWGI